MFFLFFIFLLKKTFSLFDMNIYVYYNRNLYLCTGTTEGVGIDGGRVDVNNPPTHTEGTEVCGTVYLQWIGKLGMAKLIGIE